MHLNKKILTGAAVVAMPVGILAGMTLPGAMAAAVGGHHGPPTLVISCSNLDGDSTTVDFTDGSTQPGLSPTGVAFNGGAAISSASRSNTLINSSGTPTNCSGGGSVTISGPPSIPTITGKPTKEFVIQNCAGFASGASDLKGKTITIPTTAGAVAFKIKTAVPQQFSNPATSDDPTGGDEVGFAMTGTATLTGYATDKTASASVWLDPADSGNLASCAGGAATYAGPVITGATVDPQDSTFSF